MTDQPPELPGSLELQITHTVLLQLIDYFGRSNLYSLGDEGYIALQMADDVVQECLKGTWGDI
jgi:hypothetical protein